jgi:hypothetical protein
MGQPWRFAWVSPHLLIYGKQFSPICQNPCSQSNPEIRDFSYKSFPRNKLENQRGLRFLSD